MKKTSISIIIPAYNEEKVLPRLLKSIKMQKYSPLEIIIADANSTDKTKKIGKEFKCRVVKGGMPAIGRNRGAKIAKNELLLFLDADVQLPKNFIKKAVSEFYSRKIDVAGVNIHPISNKTKDKLLHQAYNLFQNLTNKIDPLIPGACIFVKSDVFKKLKGFDEKIIIAEDHAFARKAKKNNFKVRLLKKHIFADTRRLEKDGRKKFIINMVLLWLKRFGKEIEQTKIKYELRDR
jgi:glycosyltransferase involved in cell wall biosynthesis